MSSRSARRAHKKLVAQVNRARNSGKVCMPKKAELLLLKKKPKKISPMEKPLCVLSLSPLVSEKLSKEGAITVADVHHIFQKIKSGEREIRGVGPQRLKEVEGALSGYALSLGAL